jgi:hypothetical protein
MNRAYLEVLSEPENLSAAAVGADRETVAKLCRAAPVMGLALLNDLDFARRVAEHFEGTDAPLGELALQRVGALGRVLAAAGIEGRE